MNASIFYIKLNLTDDNYVPKTSLYQLKITLLPPNASNSSNSASNSSDPNDSTILSNFSAIGDNYMINGKLVKKNSIA